MPPFTYNLLNSGSDVVIAQVIRIAEKLDADGRPAQASEARRAIIEHRDELQTIAQQIAVMGEREIREAEESSRVRPDTGGGGGPRLGDFIGKSHAIPRSLGSVGMNDESVLEQGGVGWWWTNEEGYSGHIGRTFIGAFDGTRPDPTRSGEHALLQMGRGPGSGKGTIKEPIPERRFVQRGGQVAEAEWHRLVRASREHMIRRIENAVLRARATPPTTPAKTARRVARGRRP
jgi:hypothetical protein